MSQQPATRGDRGKGAAPRRRSGGGGRGRGRGNGRSNGKSGGGRARGEVALPYPAHVSAEEAEAGIAEGRMYSGQLRVLQTTDRDALKAFVTCEQGGFAGDIQVYGMLHRNRAFHGDRVCIELLDRSEWFGGRREETASKKLRDEVEVADVAAALASAGLGGAPAAAAKSAEEHFVFPEERERRAVHAASARFYGDDNQLSLWAPLPTASDDQEGAAEEPPRPSLSETGALALRLGLQPKARVVRVLSRAPWREQSGALRAGATDGRMAADERFAHFVCDDRRFGTVLVPRARLPIAFVEAPSRFGGVKFLCRAGSWPADSAHAVAHSVRYLGEIGDIATETIAILTRHGLLHGADAEAPFGADGEESEAEGTDGAGGEGGGEGGRLGGRGGRNPRVAPPNPSANPSANPNPSSSPSPNPSASVDAPCAAMPEFRADILEELAARFGKEWRIPPEEIGRRRDFRGERIFTIDPTGAKDLDDALHVRPTADGGAEVGVHIADVTHFVTEGSKIDLEAQRRCTSVYLVQSVIPMLPPLLSEVYCSLNPNVDRLSFSCVFRLDAEGSLLGAAPFLGRGVIRSCCKLDYAIAQRMITGEIPEDCGPDLPERLWPSARRPREHAMADVVADVRVLQRIAARRRARRLGGGALVLSNPKLSFSLGASGNPTGFREYPIRDSNRLIEEYMLLANYIVARHLCANAGGRAVLRRHPPPKGEEVLKAAREVSAATGVAVDASSARALAESLRAVGRLDIGAAAKVLCSNLLTMPMQNALYFAASGVEDARSWRHYALNIPYYTHFTSPIRRYADVLAHRVLQATLKDSYARDEGLGLDGLPPGGALHARLERCNEMNLASKAAQQESDLLFLAIYCRSGAIVERGIVQSVGENGFHVNLVRIGVTQRVNARQHPTTTAFQTHRFDAASQSITMVPRGGAPADEMLRSVRADDPNADKAAFRRCEVKAFQELWVLVRCAEAKQGEKLDVELIPMAPVRDADGPIAAVAEGAAPAAEARAELAFD